MRELTVLVYDDDGVSQTSLQSILSIFRTKMLYLDVPIVEIGTISSQDILNDKLLQADCLIMPGGADLPYCDRLNGRGNEKIRAFIAEGNMYIGICAGAYYAAKSIAFTGDGYRINGDRELALFSGQAVGSIAEFTNGRYYDETAATKAIVNLKFNTGERADFYYHGGSHFLGGEPERCVASYHNGKSAAVYGAFGKGSYFLSGVHFELCATVYEKLIFLKGMDAKLSPQALRTEKQLLTLLAEQHYGIVFYKKIAHAFRELI